MEKCFRGHILKSRSSGTGLLRRKFGVNTPLSPRMRCGLRQMRRKDFEGQSPSDRSEITPRDEASTPEPHNAVLVSQLPTGEDPLRKLRTSRTRRAARLFRCGRLERLQPSYIHQAFELMRRPPVFCSRKMIYSISEIL